MLRRILLFTIIVLVVPVAWSDPPKDQGDDATRMQGDWHATSCILDGSSILKKEGGLETIVAIRIRGNAFNYVQVTQGKGTAIGVEVKYQFKIDATANPKTIEIEVLEGEGKGATLPGIYSFEDKKLKIVLNMKGGKTNPKEFTGKAGSNQWLFVLEPGK
jgi:uncharacterized protein (TIGR03067 family)